VTLRTCTDPGCSTNSRNRNFPSRQITWRGGKKSPPRLFHPYYPRRATDGAVSSRATSRLLRKPLRERMKRCDNSHPPPSPVPLLPHACLTHSCPDCNFPPSPVLLLPHCISPLQLQHLQTIFIFPRIFSRTVYVCQYHTGSSARAPGADRPFCDGMQDSALDEAPSVDEITSLA